MRRLVAVLVPFLLVACATSHTPGPTPDRDPASGPDHHDDSVARALGRDADKFLEDGRYEDALNLYRRAWEGGLRHPGALYDAGVIAARAGNVEESLQWLDRAADNGFSNTKALEEESFLAGVRQEPAYARIAEKVAANANKKPTRAAPSTPAKS